MTGKNPPKATTEEIQEYQRAHIENFKRLFGLGKLSTAGPMSDPGKRRRGILILTPPKEIEIPPLFATDPYVAKGFMELELYPIKVVFGGINTTNIDPNGIEENRIVLFNQVHETKVAHLPENLAREHEAYLKSGKSVGLAFFAHVTENKGNLRAIALFRGKDDAAIRAWLDQEPVSKAGFVKAEVIPQWLGKGILSESKQ